VLGLVLELVAPPPLPPAAAWFVAPPLDAALVALVSVEADAEALVWGVTFVEELPFAVGPSSDELSLAQPALNRVRATSAKPCPREQRSEA
jgi:hypothetical protein